MPGIRGRIRPTGQSGRIPPRISRSCQPAPSTEFVEDAGLMTYGANRADLVRRAATYVDKILKGAKPADLPVEQPKKFQFIVNLKAAKQIGLILGYPCQQIGQAVSREMISNFVLRP